jgi:DNA-binding response OmpR family regulator
LDVLRIACEKNPTLIITTDAIQGLNGFEVCREIKSNLKFCHIPLIFLTSKNTIDQIIKGYEVGADNIIPKPFDINVLAAQVNRLIPNRILIQEKYLTQNFTGIVILFLCKFVAIQINSLPIQFGKQL